MNAAIKRESAVFKHCGHRTLVISVPGDPVSQERPRVVRGHAFDPKKCVEAKEKIKEYAEQAMAEQGYRIAHKDMPVIMTCWFYRRIPTSKTQWMRSAMRYNLLAPTPKYKDLDNCIKLVGDALNKVAFEDDAQIVEMHAYARYDVEPHTDVMIEAYYVNNGDIREEIKRLDEQMKENN